MEQLHADGIEARRVLAHPAQDAAKRILLLDCQRQRRELRAEALVNRGVLVDRAAETVVARTLWKPGIYDLVLVDLRGADADCAAFIAYVQGESTGQRFGFYLAQAPYVTASARECRDALDEETFRRVAADGNPPGEAGLHCDGTGLKVAARRIAALKQMARIKTQPRETSRLPEFREERARATSVSEAVRRADRLLGGA
jgi:CheY-like chemotaxis protein